MAYINREKFAEAICNCPAIDESAANAVISLLHRQTTADVEEVKHGEWITVYSESGYHKECSVCGSRWMLDSKEYICKETKRCYECGARMDGGKAE